MYYGGIYYKRKQPLIPGHFARSNLNQNMNWSKLNAPLILSTCSITQCDITRDAQTPQQGTLPNIHEINTQSNVEENFHIK
jgi:hypothetical protein